MITARPTLRRMICEANRPMRQLVNTLSEFAALLFAGRSTDQQTLILVGYRRTEKHQHALNLSKGSKGAVVSCIIA